MRLQKGNGNLTETESFVIDPTYLLLFNPSAVTQLPSNPQFIIKRTMYIVHAPLHLYLHTFYIPITHGLRTPRESSFSKIRDFWAWADRLG